MSIGIFVRSIYYITARHVQHNPAHDKHMTFR